MAYAYQKLRSQILYPNPGSPPIPEYQAQFSSERVGPTIVTNDEEIPLVRVNPSDARAAEKSLMALTIVKASFRDCPPLDENAAFQALARAGNEPDAPLPPGFYLIGPDGKIASSLLGSIVGGGDDGDDAALAAVAAANPKSFSTPHWVTLARFELDKFLQNTTRFADSLERGVGSEESLAVRGVRIQCRHSGDGGALRPGYPAPWLVDSEVSSSRPQERAALSRVAAAAGRKENPGKGLRVDPFSALVPLAALRKVPIFNHNGTSDLANARDISSVSERVSQRQKMLEHLFEGWSEIHVLLSGAKDEEIGADPADPVADRIRSGEALSSRPFGDDRRFLGKAAGTSAVSGGGKTLIMSTDFSLVDGQHSTRDYWLIAAGLGLDPGARFNPQSGPVHSSDPNPAIDCAPEKLKAAFAGMLSKLLKKDPEAPLLNGKPMDRQVAEELGAGGKISGEARAVFEELFEDFKLSVGERRARVQFDPVATDNEARVVIEQANAKNQLSVAAKASLDHYKAVAEFCDMFNQTAEEMGDPTRVDHVKGLRSNPAFCPSASDCKSFESIFPPLMAMFTPAKPSVDALKQIERQASAEAAALCLIERPWLAEEGLPADDREFLAHKRRFAVMLRAAGRLKSSGFSVGSGSVGETLAALQDPAKANEGFSLDDGEDDGKKPKARHISELAMSKARDLCVKLISDDPNGPVGARAKERLDGIDAEALLTKDPQMSRLRAYILTKSAIAVAQGLEAARALPGVADTLSEERQVNVFLTLMVARETAFAPTNQRGRGECLDRLGFAGEGGIASIQGLARLEEGSLSYAEASLAAARANGGRAVPFNDPRETLFSAMRSEKFARFDSAFEEHPFSPGANGVYGKRSLAALSKFGMSPISDSFAENPSALKMLLNAVPDSNFGNGPEDSPRIQASSYKRRC